MADGTRRFYKRTDFWIFVAVSVLFLFIGEVLPQDWGRWRSLPSNIGWTLLPTVIVGFILGERFSREIASDVFRASMGYLLPKYLRPEMQWLHQHKLIGKQTVLSIRLEELSPDAVRVLVRITRTIVNEGDEDFSLDSPLSIDEWFNPSGESRISEFSLRKGHKQVNLNDKNMEIEKGDYFIRLKHQLILRPRESMLIALEYSEVKRSNDIMVFNFSYPTVSPMVEIDVFPELNSIVHFPHRGKRVDLNSRQYVLEGTLLPGQQVIVRWWKCSESKAWLAKV